MLNLKKLLTKILDNFTTVEFSCPKNASISRGNCQGRYSKATGMVTIQFACNSTTDIATTQELFNIPTAYRPSADKAGFGMLRNSANTASATELRARASSGSIVQLGSGTTRSVFGVIEYKL